MQVVLDKCYILNQEKIFGADMSYRFQEKHKKQHTLILKK